MNLIPNGLKIKELRDQRGWSQEEMANQMQAGGMKCSRGQVYRAEKGLPISERSLGDFANILGVSVEDLRLVVHLNQDMGEGGMVLVDSTPSQGTDEPVVEKKKAYLLTEEQWDKAFWFQSAYTFCFVTTVSWVPLAVLRFEQYLFPADPPMGFFGFRGFTDFQYLTGLFLIGMVFGIPWCFFTWRASLRTLPYYQERLKNQVSKSKEED